MKKFVGAVVLALTVALAGCSQGGGDCGGILQYCEPEETSTASDAPLDPGGGAVPPGGAGGTVVGGVTLFAGVLDPNQRAVNNPVTVTVHHELANRDDIPLVMDPYTKVMMPNGHTFGVPETPFTYTVEIRSDTVEIDFTVTTEIRAGGAVTCTLYDGPVEIPGAARVAFAGLQAEGGVPTVSVTCTWFLGM